MRSGKVVIPTVVALVFSVRIASPAIDDFTLNQQEYFERPAASVLVFHNTYPEGKQGGIEIVQHGERVASLGDVRLEPIPGQWGRLPKVGQREVDRATARIEVPLRFEQEQIDYRIRVQACGEAVCVTADLLAPLPPAQVGRAGLNLELFPPAFFAKTYHLGKSAGVFPLQGNGPRLRQAAGNLQPVPLAQGVRLVVAPEDPLRRLTVEADSSELLLFDGRDNETNGWFVVRSLIAAGVTKGAVKWRITPHAVPGWRRPPVIAVSQVGYHPRQVKRAVVELGETTGSPASTWCVAATAKRRHFGSRRTSIAKMSGSRPSRHSCRSRCVT